QSHQNADLAETRLDRIVDVAFHDAIGDRNGLRAAQVHVLADLGDGFGQFGRNRVTGAGERHFAELDDIAIGIESQLGNGANDVLELLVAGNEVGLGVDFHDGGLGAGGGNT